MKKVILINILIIFGLLIILEAFCSIVFYIKDEKNPLVLSESVIDLPYVYYTFIPEKKNNIIRVNNDGLYTHYDRNKPANAIRIVLMGGSTVRGMLSANTISDALEKLLEKDFPEKEIEVVNAGMSGYVMEQLFIFYQLILAKYNPDMLVGLNGYNDLMSVKLNRYSGIFFAPQNMQQFKVIEEGKSKKALMGRFRNIFPHTFRMVNSLKRQVLKQSQYDYLEFNDARIKEAASVYLDIIQDMHSFSSAKGISYLEFLQPVRWYIKGNLEESVKRGGTLALVKLYSSYEKGLTGLDYGYSLVDLFNNQDEFFRDDCHVYDAAAEIIALRMLSPIKKELIKKLRQ